MRLLVAATLIASLFCSVAGAADAPERARTTIDSPTVIAFFESVSAAELEKDPDLSEALDDFQFYLRSTRETLDGTSVKLHEIYASELVVVDGDSETRFTPEVPVGYYLIAPREKPRIEYGVHTDADLLAIIESAFGAQARTRHAKD